MREIDSVRHFMPESPSDMARYNVPMFRLIRSLRVAIIGLIVAGLGITLYLLLFNVIDLKPSPAMLNAYVALSIAMTLGGLGTALVGTVTWARRAPRRHVFLAAASISLVGVLLVVFVNVNIHDQTAILMFVIMAAVVGVGLLLITMFVERR
jgi:hypothetical protein